MKDLSTELKYRMKYSLEIHNHLLGIKEFLQQVLKEIKNKEEKEHTENFIKMCELQISYSLANIMSAVNRITHLVKDENIKKEIAEWELYNKVVDVVDNGDVSVPMSEFVTYKYMLNTDLENIQYRFDRILDSIDKKSCPAYKDVRSALIRSNAFIGQFFHEYRRLASHVSTIREALIPMYDKYGLKVEKDELGSSMDLESFIYMYKLLLICMYKSEESEMKDVSILSGLLADSMAKVVNNAMIVLNSYDIVDASKFNDMPISAAIQELSTEYAEEIENMSLSHIEYVANYNMENKVPNAVQITLLNELEGREAIRSTAVLYSQADVMLPLLWYDVIKWMVANVNDDESDDAEVTINMIIENIKFLLDNNSYINKMVLGKAIIDSVEELIESENEDPKHWN